MHTYVDHLRLREHEREGTEAGENEKEKEGEGESESTVDRLVCLAADDSSADAGSREQDSLKDALLAKLGKTGTLVSDRCRSCAKRPMWNCLLYTSMGFFRIEICNTSRWRRTRMPGGATGARARRCYTISLFVSQAS